MQRMDVGEAAQVEVAAEQQRADDHQPAKAATNQCAGAGCTECDGNCGALCAAGEESFVADWVIDESRR